MNKIMHFDRYLCERADLFFETLYVNYRIQKNWVLRVLCFFILGYVCAVRSKGADYISGLIIVAVMFVLNEILSIVYNNRSVYNRIVSSYRDNPIMVVVRIIGIASCLYTLLFRNPYDGTVMAYSSILDYLFVAYLTDKPRKTKKEFSYSST